METIFIASGVTIGATFGFIGIPGFFRDAFRHGSGRVSDRVPDPAGADHCGHCGAGTKASDLYGQKIDA